MTGNKFYIFQRGKSMKTKLYREPSALKRFIDRQFVQVMFEGLEFNMLRLRWWLPVGFLTAWLGHNLLLIVWYMLAAIQGRTVMFNPDGWWYWPLRTFFQIF